MVERQKQRKREWETGREISKSKNKEYKKEIIFYMDVLKTIHIKDKQSKNEVQRKRKVYTKNMYNVSCTLYNNIHTYHKLPGF